MSEYNPEYLNGQNLYGSEGFGSSHPGSVRHGDSSGSGAPKYGHYGPRGPRRSGGGNHSHGYRSAPSQQYRDVMSPEEWYRKRLRDTLFRLGDRKEGSQDEFHPPSELFRLKEETERLGSKGGEDLAMIASSIKIMAVEQPHKTPLIAALIGFMVLSPGADTRQTQDSQEHQDNVEKPADTQSNEVVHVGDYLMNSLVVAFRNDLDARLWRNVRLLLHLFASMLSIGIFSAPSLRSVLTSFAAVLEEPGVAAARGDRAVVCIVETMCRAGLDLCKDEDEEKQNLAKHQLDEVLERIDRYASEYRQVEAELVRPFALSQKDTKDENHVQEESFETIVEAAKALQRRGYGRPVFLPSPLDLLPPPIVSLALGPHQKLTKLPEVLIPPDDEFDANKSHPVLSTATGDGARNQNREKKSTKSKSDEAYRAGIGFNRVFRYPRWFKGSVPDPTSPESVVLRSTFHDIIDLYQVNRRESAKILFEMPRWLRKGTFVGKSIGIDVGIFGLATDEWQVSENGEMIGAWSLEEMIVESILSTSLILPVSPQKPLYYTSLLREIVLFSPQSIAPAMGKSIRRVYNVSCTGGADVETIRRFADWFSVHLSNFNFNWNWKEWIPDMTLPRAHPKISFIRRIVELEIRLAYYERVKTTLPQEIQEKVLGQVEPGPNFTYADENHPFHEAALDFIQSMRARATAEIILANSQSFKKSIMPAASTSFVPSSDEPDGGFKVQDEMEADYVVRDVIIQSLLSVGSRSFSHFLNVVERYHGLLRQISTSPSMRIAILATTVRFWSRSPLWIVMITDKWLQYRIIEPADVIEFIFNPPKGQFKTGKLAVDEDVANLRDWSDFNWWEIIKLTIYKVHGRVEQVRRRLNDLQQVEIERMEKLEAVKEAGGALDDGKGGAGNAPGASSLPLFPSGATQSTLPRRPDLPPMQLNDAHQQTQKQQTVEEAKASFDNILQEQRKVLVSSLQGFVSLLRSHENTADVWKRHGQENNDDETWQVWWIKGWYIEYCRLFAKELATHREIMVANVFSDEAQNNCVYDVFDRCSQMATE